MAPQGSLDELLDGAQEGNYVCVQAFVDPTDENEGRIDALVQTIRARTGCVTTHGFGPRYLHSTGQLHKGGPPIGRFVQIVDDTGEEIPVPGKDFGFGKLIRAQAAGDLPPPGARSSHRSNQIGGRLIVPHPPAAARWRLQSRVMRRPQSRPYPPDTNAPCVLA